LTRSKILRTYANPFETTFDNTYPVISVTAAGDCKEHLFLVVVGLFQMDRSESLIAESDKES